MRVHGLVYIKFLFQPGSEPDYMNSEVKAPKRPSPLSYEHTKAAAAIDEALNGLSSSSDTEEIRPNSPVKV